MSDQYTTPVRYQKLLTNHSTCATFPTLDLSLTTTPASVDVLADPSANYGVIRCERNHLILIPYGTNAANDIFKIRVYRYNAAWTPDVGAGITLQWLPTQIVEATCTLGTPAGTASLIVVATDLTCDTIAVDTDKSYTLYSVSSNANNVNAAFITCDMLGAEYAAITFELSTGAVAMNALYGWVS